MAETEREKTIKGAADIIKPILDAAKAAAEGSPTPTSTDPIDVQKAEARKLTLEIQLDPEKARMRMQVAPKETIDVTEGKARVAKAITKAGSEVSWLIASPSELNYNTQAMSTVARIADVPTALRDDPHYLLSEGAKLFWSTNWEELSSEAATEVQTVLQRIYLRIDELKARTPDFTIEDAIVKENLFVDKEKPKVETITSKGELGDDLLQGIDSSRLSYEDRRKFDAMKEVLNQSGNSADEAVTMELVNSFVNQTERMLQRADTSEGAMESAKIVNSLRSRLQEYKNQDRIPSTIMLTSKEVAQIIENPIRFMEWMSQDIATIAKDRGFDSPIIEQRLNRYRLITDYFVSDAFNAEKKLELPLGATVEQAKRFREIHKGLLDTKSDILNQYTDRLHGLEFSYYIQQVGDFEKDTQFIRLLDKINERGAYGLRAQYGGLSEVAMQKMRSIHDGLLRDPANAEKYRSLPEVMEDVRKMTSRAMYEERALWEPQFQKYLEDLTKSQEGFIPKPTVEYTEQLCDTITAVAESSYQMFFEKEQIMARGLDPGLAQRLRKINAYETADAEEKIMATFRYRDWFLRKWNGMISGEKALWNARAEWYVFKDPELRKYASEQTDKLFKELQSKSTHWKQEAKSGDSKKIDAVIEDPLFRKLQTVFSEYEERHEIGHEKAKEIIFFANLKHNKLYRQVKCEVGGEVAQLQGARCYGYWESLPRRDVVREMIKLNPLLKQIYGDEKTRSIAVGLDLFEAGRGWFFPDRVRSEGAKENFMNKGERALQLQPHLFYKMEHMREEIHLGAPAAKTLNEVTQRFDSIQSKLMLSGEGSIDYSQTSDRWTEGQRRIMKDTFEMAHNDNEKNPFSLSQQQYVDQMKAYYEHFNDGFKRFTHVKYISDFAFVTFTNDIPVAVLENKNVLDVRHIALTRGAGVASAVEAYLDPKVFAQLSHHSTLNGVGKAGLWRRSWADFGAASSTIPLQNDLLNQDEKVFAKSLQELRNKVKAYQGPAEGDKSALEAIVGYLKTAQVKGGYSDFLKGMKNSSIMKEYWGDMAKSLALDEVSEEYDKFELLLGKLGKEAPGAEEALKDYVKITNWRRFLGGDEGIISKIIGEENFDKMVEKLNENAPKGLYLFKSRNASLFMLAILMLFAVDQAKKGAEGSSSGEKKSH